MFQQNGLTIPQDDTRMKLEENIEDSKEHDGLVCLYCFYLFDAFIIQNKIRFLLTNNKRFLD